MIKIELSNKPKGEHRTQGEILRNTVVGKKRTQKKPIKQLNSIKVEVKTEPFTEAYYTFSDADKNNKICRVCLKEATIPIFGSDKAKIISETLSTIVAIDINENDNLPKYLCVACYNVLQSAVILRNTAQKTDKLLRRPKSVPKDVKRRRIKQLKEDDDDSNYDCTFSDYDPLDKEKQYYCNRCNINFDNRKIYSAHTKTEEHRNFKVECTICKRFYTTFYIKRHILRHRLDPEQAYICDVCGKSFVILGAFNRHRAIHTFELPFKCEQCPYRGRFTESLKMHMRTHTGEKPYACTQCPARFINKSNLNKHSSTHKTEHDYKCDICNRGYFRKRDLELHIKVYHSGIKEHVCNICGKEFGYRKQMMKHQLKVHKREKLKSGRVPLYLLVEKHEKKVAQELEIEAAEQL